MKIFQCNLNHIEFCRRRKIVIVNLLKFMKREEMKRGRRKPAISFFSMISNTKSTTIGRHEVNNEKIINLASVEIGKQMVRRINELADILYTRI